MQQTTILTKPRSFTYSTDVVKIGQRAGILSSEGKEEFRVASPPEFKGEAGVWTPEDLFVAAVDSCTMMTFLALASRNSLTVLDYTSHAIGVLESVEGKFRFSKVTLKPRIAVESIHDIERAKELLKEAHQSCFIANSIISEVIVEPLIQAS
ncbi:OsmC family protein [bacterium]|nr:OsmC family protein [bacterium]